LTTDLFSTAVPQLQKLDPTLPVPVLVSDWSTHLQAGIVKAEELVAGESGQGYGCISQGAETGAVQKPHGHVYFKPLLEAEAGEDTKDGTTHKLIYRDPQMYLLEFQKASLMGKSSLIYTSSGVYLLDQRGFVPIYRDVRAADIVQVRELQVCQLIQIYAFIDSFLSLASLWNATKRSRSKVS
jgi:hypothetical protein